MNDSSKLMDLRTYAMIMLVTKHIAIEIRCTCSVHFENCQTVLSDSLSLCVSTEMETDISSDELQMRQKLLTQSFNSNIFYT